MHLLQNLPHLFNLTNVFINKILQVIAHATMLAKVGVLTEAERDDIIQGLSTIQAEIEAGILNGVLI
jgi:argininosuccinate lyase